MQDTHASNFLNTAAMESCKTFEVAEEAERKLPNQNCLVWIRWLLHPTLRKEVISIVVLSVVLVVVVGLLSLPIIFYRLGPEEDEKDRLSSSASATCVPYTGEACFSTLITIQQCSLKNVSHFEAIVTPLLGDLETTIETIEKVMTFLSLPISGATDACKVAAGLFTCQYFLPLCNTTDEVQVILPSAQECFYVLNQCANAFNNLVDFDNQAQGLLPNCSSLPVVASTGSCKANQTEFQKLSGHNITCREDFSMINGTCVARCDAWEQNSHSEVLLVEGALICAGVIGLVGGIAVVIIAFIQREKMFAFPAVLIVYHTLSCGGLAIIILANFINQDGLFCSSEESVLGGLENPSTFCTISGVVRNYTILNLTLWWFFHICCLFWKVMFPIHARVYQRYSTRIHIGLVVAGLTLPLPGIAVAFATGGFAIKGFPPLLCAPEDVDVGYYSLWMIMNLLLIGGIIQLIILTWKVHKRQFFLRKDTQKAVTLSTAEKKLILVFVYYIVFASLTLAFFSVLIRDHDKFLNAVTEYFICEAGGYNPDNPCPRDYEQYRYPYLESSVYMVMGFIPLVNLLFVLNIQDLRQKLRRAFPQFKKLSAITKRYPLSSTDEGCDTPAVYQNETDTESRL